MLIHPWDAALDSAEWRDWLAATGRFGMLAVNNLDPARAPLVLPLHFSVAGDELFMTWPGRIRSGRTWRQPPRSGWP
jgi:transcriptional regulator